MLPSYMCVCMTLMSHGFKDPGRYRDHDRRLGRTVLPSSWRYPSPWSVSSFLLTSSSPAPFHLNPNSHMRNAGFWRLEDKAGLPLDAIHISGHVPQCMCLFLTYFLRVTLHAPGAWQMKKNFSRRSRASFGAFPQAHPYNVTTGSSMSSHQHQRHYHLQYHRNWKSSLGPKARLAPRTCLGLDRARNRQNPYRRECAYGSSARHCGGYHAVVQLSSRYACT